MVINRQGGQGDVTYRDRFALKPEDSAPPTPDPEQMSAQHMALLRANAAAATELVKTIQGWHEDPIGGQRAALARALELSEKLDRAVGSGERAVKAKRLAGHFSHQYSSDLGVR